MSTSATPAVTATLSVEEARAQLAVQVGEMNKCKDQMGALQQVCSACVWALYSSAVSAYVSCSVV
jgi:hypothetical protein